MDSSFVAVFLLAALASFGTSPVRARDVGKVYAAGLMFDAAQVDLMKREGAFLRTYYNSGCVAGGCCNPFFWPTRSNDKCPLAEWFKWFFNGPFLVNHKPVLNQCLDCLKGELNCRIGTQWCNRGRSQQWHFEFEKNRTTELGNALFTIHNALFPKQCATLDLESKNKLVLSDCDPQSRKEQLFYIDRDWFQAAMERSEN